MKVKVTELQRICDVLLNRFGSRGIEDIELDKDFYWDIPAAQRYDPYVEPTTHTLGQLETDWNELREVLGNDKAAINYHIVWLSAIMRAIGEVSE